MSDAFIAGAGFPLGDAFLQIGDKGGKQIFAANVAAVSFAQFANMEIGSARSAGSATFVLGSELILGS